MQISMGEECVGTKDLISTSLLNLPERTTQACLKDHFSVTVPLGQDGGHERDASICGRRGSRTQSRKMGETASHCTGICASLSALWLPKAANSCDISKWNS